MFKAYIVILVIVIIAMCFIGVVWIKESHSNKDFGYYVIWSNAVQESGEKTYIYSLKENKIVYNQEGIMIWGNTKSDLICYEKLDGYISLYSINAELQKEFLSSLTAPESSRIIAFMNNCLYYTLNDHLMCMKEDGSVSSIMKIKTANAASACLLPSFDGKWVYDYYSDTDQEYHIEVFNDSGQVEATMVGLFPTWYSNHELVYVSAIKREGLFLHRYDLLTNQSTPLMKHDGQTLNVEYSLFYTSCATVDPTQNYLVYDTKQLEKFFGFTTNNPAQTSLSCVNLHDGNKTTIKLPQQTSRTLWYINILPLHDFTNIDVQ